MFPTLPTIVFCTLLLVIPRLPESTGRMVNSSNTGNKGGISATSLFGNKFITLNSSGGLYVADGGNKRVLYFATGSTTAFRVFGQGGNFTSDTTNKGGVSADSLSSPFGVTLDNSGGLYIADTNNNRVLYYV